MARQCYQYVLAIRTETIKALTEKRSKQTAFRSRPLLSAYPNISAFKDKESHDIVSESPFRLKLSKSRSNIETAPEPFPVRDKNYTWADTKTISFLFPV